MNIKLIHLSIQHPRRFLMGAFFIVCLAGCSSISIESAKNLGTAGKEASVQSSANVFVSNDEYQRAMDAEAFFHAFAGTSIPQQLSTDYEAIQTELNARKIVFSKLGDVYDAFSTLAATNAATGVETAINGLGNAVNDYASTFNKSPVISNSAQGFIAGIGGLVAAEIQKRKIKQSSVLIRERLNEFDKLFNDPLVRSQIITFKQSIAQTRASAIKLLWESGIIDPSPLINQMSADAGLKASKEAAKLLNNQTINKNGTNSDLKDSKEASKLIINPPTNKKSSDADLKGSKVSIKKVSKKEDTKDQLMSRIRDGLGGVIENRFNQKINLIERGYVAGLKAVKELIEKHEKLEDGEELNLARLRQIVAELQRITELILPKEKSSVEK